MATSSVGTSSVVKLNKSYSNKRTKFKVTAPLQKDTQQVPLYSQIIWLGTSSSIIIKFGGQNSWYIIARLDISEFNYYQSAKQLA